MALGSVFLSTLLLSFALTLAVTGVLGAYFGKGKSRSMGWVLCLIAVLLVGLFVALTWQVVPDVAPVFNPGIVAQSMVAVVAATAGSILAFILFIAAVKRS